MSRYFTLDKLMSLINDRTRSYQIDFMIERDLDLDEIEREKNQKKKDQKTSMTSYICDFPLNRSDLIKDVNSYKVTVKQDTTIKVSPLYLHLTKPEEDDVKITDKDIYIHDMEWLIEGSVGQDTVSLIRRRSNIMLASSDHRFDDFILNIRDFRLLNNYLVTEIDLWDTAPIPKITIDPAIVNGPRLINSDKFIPVDEDGNPLSWPDKGLTPAEFKEMVKNSGGIYL